MYSSSIVSYTPTFKSQMAMGVLRGDKTIAEIADNFEVYAGSSLCDRFCSKISVLTGLPMMP